MKRILIGVSMALAALLVFQAGPAGAGKGPTDDNDFLVKAFTSGVAEVKFSELAEDRSDSNQVKAFAQRMINSHKKVNDQLSEHARGLKLAVVAGLEKDKRAIYDRLAGLKGAEFDRAYLQQLIEDHDKAVKLFEGQARTGTHEGLKNFAQQTLPTLRDHLKHARLIHDNLGKPRM